MEHGVDHNIVCVSVEYIVIGKVTPYGDTTNWPPTAYCAHTMLRLMNCAFCRG